jgi:hypothetical protein
VVKLCSTAKLIENHVEARKRKYNQVIPNPLLGELDENGTHVVCDPPMLHETGFGSYLSVRCIVLIKLTNQEEPWEVVLDFVPILYNKLPNAPEDS